VSESSTAYKCDIDSFKPDQRHQVRWLQALTTDADGDFDLLAEFERRRGQTLSPDDLRTVTDKGFTYAAVIQHGAIVARAAQWTYSDESWELAAVFTVEGRRGEGLARSVCTFVTAFILAAGKVATCHTPESNIGMRRVAESLGFIAIAR
jgi:predicted GNAT family acetyltransferase